MSTIPNLVYSFQSYIYDKPIPHMPTLKLCLSFDFSEIKDINIFIKYLSKKHNYHLEILQVMCEILKNCSIYIYYHIYIYSFTAHIQSCITYIVCINIWGILKVFYINNKLYLSFFNLIFQESHPQSCILLILGKSRSSLQPQ